MQTTSERNIDVAIVGGGIMGLSIARELVQRHPGIRLAIFEKESSLGCHASGRNSGVLHSGVYYPPNSLKAKVCAEGAGLLAAYCQTANLPFKRCGKVILPTSISEDAQLDLLLARAETNGAEARLIDNDELRALEPEAVSCTGRALHIPQTAVFDPLAILTHLGQELHTAGVRFCFDSPVTTINPKERVLKAGKDWWSYGLLINTGGLFADRLAQRFGIGQHIRVLPFKGLYYQLTPQSPLAINGLIYPVPDLDMPFLGVHFTKAISGTVYLGPSALPSLGRENYRGVEGLEPAEIPAILGNLMDFYLHDRQHFRKFAHQEIQRLLKRNFVQACRAMVPRIRSGDVQPSPKVGIRPQLVDIRNRALILDFMIEQAEGSLHILNAISPAFTSAFSFARYVIDSYFDSTAPQSEMVANPEIVPKIVPDTVEPTHMQR